MNLNHLTVSGNLTRDPELRSVGADKSVTSFTVAHNTKFKTNDGEAKEEVTFIDCEAWGRQGEIAAQFLTKGSMVIVEGRIKQDNWTDKDGQKRSKLKISVEKVHLMPRGGNKDERDERDERELRAPTQQSTASPSGASSAPRSSPGPSPQPPNRAPMAPAGTADEPPF